MSFLNIIKSEQNNKIARVIDGKMILSFPDAKTPILWQMELSNVKISALEIQTKNDESVLVLKNPKGDAIEIATFLDHDKAVKNLIAIANEFGKSQGQIQTHNEVVSVDDYPPKGFGWIKKIMITLVVIFLGVVLIGIFGSSSQKAPVNMAPAAPQSGQPMSADDFLKGK